MKLYPYVIILFMKPQPFYSASNLHRPAYSLKYAWTGWPSDGVFPPLPGELDLKSLDQSWESDGLRRLDINWESDRATLLFSVRPNISPIQFTKLVKGRLQHSLRNAGCPLKFSRKVSFKTIGENTIKDVENYIVKQVEKERFIDEQFAERLTKYSKINKQVDLVSPVSTRSGRYWYNLHVVFVTYKRYKIVEDEMLTRLDVSIQRIADQKSHRISARSLMPDHLHFALSGDVASSPEEIALCYMNNLSYMTGRKPLWQPSYYVGTFGEYDIGVIRARAAAYPD